ncbi:MAG: hypothetical protein JHC31_15925 [Sulfurihydrogenibium sp.]|jgi:hypothetical protein|nr:hypothetical protein [Sulfurihydrogenibium sp.]
MDSIDLIFTGDLKYIYIALAIITGIPSSLYITISITKNYKNKIETIPFILITTITTIIVIFLSIKYTILAYSLFTLLLTPIAVLLLEIEIKNKENISNNKKTKEENKNQKD